MLELFRSPRRAMVWFVEASLLSLLVCCAPGFHRQHIVMNGASDLLVSVFGEAGKHARSSVGMAELPMNIAVEVELIARAG